MVSVNKTPFCLLQFGDIFWLLCTFLPMCRNEIRTTPFLHLRYEGTDCALMVMPEGISVDECRHGNFKATFTHRLWGN